MTIPASSPPAPDPVRWLINQPYLLLSLTSLFWAGNIVLARYVAGHVQPMTLSCVRWIGAFVMLLPFVGPNRAAPFLHLVPVFGSAMAILLLGEQPRLFHLIGYVMVLAGVVTASRQGSAGV